MSLAARKDVPIVQEGILGLTDIDKGSLQAWFQVLDLAFEDCADLACFAGALDFKFFQDAVLELGDALLEWFGIDDQFGVSLFSFLIALMMRVTSGWVLGPLGGVILECLGVDALGFFSTGGEVSSSAYSASGFSVCGSCIVCGCSVWLTEALRALACPCKQCVHCSSGMDHW